jgi:type IV pilus assembly protein PilM
MFLGLGKPYFLGIDFGTSLIKAVELTLEKGRPKLVNYGQVDLFQIEKTHAHTEPVAHEEEMSVYLRALLERFHPKSDAAYVAMPAFIGLVSLIEMPEMSDKELAEAMPFEAHKYIPSSLEDVALSWEVVGMREAADGHPKTMEVVLVAALNKEVNRYKQCITDAHLKMEFLELETFSLARALHREKNDVVLIMDIGSRATNVILVDNGVVRVSRNLDVGGREVTRTLQEGLNITPERAEILKKSEKDFLNVPESALVFPALDMIGSEAQRILASYGERYPEKKCEKIILSGGTAQMVGLTEYYSRTLGLPVELGDPWKDIDYDPHLSEEIKALGTSFSVTLGLALAGIDSLTHRDEPLNKKKLSLKELLNKKL